MLKLERGVLREIRPTAAEDRRVQTVVAKLESEVAETASELGAHIETMLVGSVAKGTHLKDPDIDLFMLFPESTSVQRLRETGLEIGRRVLGGEEHYAQHPYVRGMYDGFEVDLVPCFKVRDTRRKLSAVDRTPFHTEFVRSHLREEQRDEVRLLKRFMKGIGCYGAEAKVQGFSGYLCELLVMRYGGFPGVLEAASGWRRGHALELKGHPGAEFSDPLTFVDPVDSGRNVASAVSVDSFTRFVVASRNYREQPRREFFFPRGRRAWGSKRLSEAAGDRLDNMVCVSMPAPDLIDDVLYPQLRKSLSSVVALLRRNDFEVVGTSLLSREDAFLLVELERVRLADERVHRGPPVDSPNAYEFLEKWSSAGLSKPYKERGRWYVVVRREFPRADDLLRDGVSRLTHGKDIGRSARFVVASGRDLLDDRYRAALTEYLDERMPWER